MLTDKNLNYAGSKILIKAFYGANDFSNSKRLYKKLKGYI